MSDAVQIVVREAQAYVSGVPQDAMSALRRATSFRPEGYQYTWAFKNGKTDGRVHLLKHSKMPTGLLGRVTGLLDQRKVPYELHFEQPEYEKPALDVGIHGVQERDYQSDAIERAMLNPRGVIRIPTGGGKSAVIARLIHARRMHSLVIVPTIDLLHQQVRFLEEHLRYPNDGLGATVDEPVTIGQLGDGVVDPRPITVATIKTAAKAFDVAYTKYVPGEYDDKERDTDVSRRKLRDWIERIGLLAIDECHLVAADTLFGIATGLPAPYKYGLSASPWRDDGADLMIEAATGPVIYRIGVEPLVEQGFLVPPMIRVVDTKGWWEPASWGSRCGKCKRQRPIGPGGPARRCQCGSDNWRSEYTDAYREEIVENPIRNQRIADMVNDDLKGPTLVLVKQIKHGNALAKLIPGARFLSGKDPGQERAQAFDDIRDGGLRVLISTSLADMGLDLPILRNLVIAGGGKSSTRHLQRIGRIVRPYEGKSFATVVRFDDGHVHKWFANHEQACTKIEEEEWSNVAVWL